jgi:hypothetical protein
VNLDRTQPESFRKSLEELEMPVGTGKPPINNHDDNKDYGMIYVVIALVGGFYLLIMWILSSESKSRQSLLKKEIGKRD